MDQTNGLSSEQAARSGFFTTSPTRSPARLFPTSLLPPSGSGMTSTDIDTSPRNLMVSSGPLQSVPSSSARRMVPRNELELSRPPISRAEKDGDDPTSSSGRRRLPFRGHSSTPATLTRLFAVQAPTSPPSSRGPSFYRQPHGHSASLGETISEDDPLPLHLYVRGLLDGKYSDIKVTVLGKSYALHRLVLDQAPFFASALSEPWLESTAKEVTLHPEEIDSNITTISFELALKRLYGCASYAEEAHEPLSMFATGCWLEMKELVESSVEHLLSQLRPRLLASVLNVVNANYYGKGGTRVLTTCKSMLGREGWLMPIRYWDDVPSEIINEVVGADSFFVYNEWRRWLFVKRLLNRRLKAVADELRILSRAPNGELSKAPSLLRARASSRSRRTGDIEPDDEEAPWITLYSHPEITPLLELLDHGVYYMHFDFEQMQHVRSSCDVFGVPLVPENVYHTALWTMMEFRQAIMRARHQDDSLGLAQLAEPPSAGATGDVLSEYQSLAASQQDPVTKDPADGAVLIENEMVYSTDQGNGPKLGNAAKRFWIPTIDCNIVTGGPDPVVTLSQATMDRTMHSGKSRQGQASNDPEPLPASYTRFPPFRFAVELPHPRSIKEDKRTYSQTIFYGGSLWNLYVRKKRTGVGKVPQVGVYLHRAKEQGPEGPPSHYGSVDERIGALEREMLLRSQPRTRHGFPGRDNELTELDMTNTGDPDSVTSPSVLTPSHVTASSLSNFLTGTKQYGPKAIDEDSSGYAALDEEPDSTPANSSDEDDHSAEDYLQNLAHAGGGAPTIPPPMDTRPVVKTYYRIYCPSKGGRLLSVYESTPENFKVSQSSGWKCNSLMLEDDGAVSGDCVEGGGGGDVSATELEDGQACEWIVGSADGGVGGGARGFGDGIKRRANRHASDGRLRLTIALGVV